MHEPDELSDEQGVLLLELVRGRGTGAGTGTGTGAGRAFTWWLSKTRAPERCAVAFTQSSDGHASSGWRAVSADLPKALGEAYEVLR